ncbi:MAG: hypothetical protein ABJL99_11380 [Aliishimia sp.]
MTRIFDAPLILRLAGPVTLMHPDGYVVTPRAAKLQALLILIATGQGMCRPRAFLQDKLWSEASPAKGAASLRQALSTLRRALEPDVLITGNTSVGLNPERITIDLQGDANLGETPEFASGLDVPDPEFEDWLRDRRAEFERLSRGVAPARRPQPSRLAVLVTLPPSCSDQGLRATTEILTSDIASQVARNGNAVVQMDPNAPGAPDRLGVQVRSARIGATVRYQVQLIDMARRQAIWTGACDSCPDGPLTEPEMFVDLSSRASFEAIKHFGKLSQDGALIPERLPYQIYAHFPFQQSKQAEAFDQWLSALQDPQSTALHLAWRARLRVVAMLERTREGPEAAEEAQAYCCKALALDPSNPMVVALTGEVALQLQAQPEVAAELARSSVELDPRSPFATAIYAQALIRCGQIKEGSVMAQRALRLSAGMPNRSWWHAVCAGAAMRSGDCDLALKHAEIAHFQAPDFRPPLRFLSGLRFNAGDEAGAAKALARIKVLEPDFSLAYMADRSYPVASMRGTPLMEVTKSGLL